MEAPAETTDLLKPSYCTGVPGESRGLRTLGLKRSLGGEEELTGQSLVVGSKELRSGRRWRPGSHLIVTVHELQPTAGLLLLHVAQGTLQAEDHVLVLLYHLWEGHT